MTVQPQRTKRRLRIWQQNLNRSLKAHLDLLHSQPPLHYNIIAIQEPHIDFLGNSHANPYWYSIYPPKHLDNPKATRSLLLVSKHLTTTNAWTQIPIDSPDITALRINSGVGPINIYNIYNDGTHHNNLNCLSEHLRAIQGPQPRVGKGNMIWLGDFNRHHPLWDEERNSHLFTAANLDAAQTLLNLLAIHDMRMALPRGIPTLEAMNTKNYTRPNNVFCTSNLLNIFIRCVTEPESRPPCTDHLPLISELDIETPTGMFPSRPNFRATDWEKFNSYLKTLLSAIPQPKEICTIEHLNSTVKDLTDTILATIQQTVPTSKPSPYSKRWWSKELTQKRRGVRKAGRNSYINRSQRTHLAHEYYRRTWNEYTDMIRQTKRKHWEKWLEEVDEHSMWTAGNLASGPSTDGGKVHIPALQSIGSDGSPMLVRDNATKGELLHKSFFPPSGGGNPTTASPNYPHPAFKYEEITDIQIHRVILKLKPYEAPGPSRIPNAVLLYSRELLVPFLGPIYRTTFNLDAYPSAWKTSLTIALQKPGKPDYALAKAYRPITLGECLAKVLSACVAETLVYHSTRLQLLPNTHFRGLPGRSTTDSLHLVVKFIKDAWRRKEVVSALFLDVKGAFPSVFTKRLIHDLRTKGIPTEYTSWLERKMSGRCTTISFDDFTSDPFTVEDGCDQGCPLSIILYLFYNAGLLEVAKEPAKELAPGFIDDIVYLVAGPDLESTHSKIADMMERPEGGLHWSSTHNSPFEPDKLRLVDFTRKRESPTNRDSVPST